MSTPVDTPTSADESAPRPLGARRRWLVPVAAAAGVGAIALSAALLVGGGDDNGTPRRTAAAAPLKLTAPDGLSMSSCLAFDETVLAGMTTAFGGTVTSLSEDKVVLDVDRWFRPKDSDVTTVELTTATGAAVAIDAVQFEEGKRYLVTAADGHVNGCGFTGPATPEFEASFERAFSG